jgi:putative SOS response-associated peptidase YedK
MCGRVVQASDPLRFAFVDGLDVPDSRAKPPSYNVAPSQLLYVIRENHETGERTSRAESVARLAAGRK